jgi:Kef-type K+ transport system membrane component KefB
MSPADRSTLLLIFLIAALAPILVELSPRVRLPVVVLEIVLGILVGPHVLGWAEAGPIITALSRLGMAFLFFLAGLEIDFKAIRGRPLQTAAMGWLLSFGIALVVGLTLAAAGVVESGLLLAGALTTTALGTLIPILRDAGQVGTRFGRFTLAAGALGEFGPIVLISAVLAGGAEGGAEGGGSRFVSVLMLITLTTIILVAAYIAAYARPTYVVKLLARKLNTSAQLPVRVSVLLLGSLIMLTFGMGLDAVLGAIAAGIVVGLACDGHTGEVVRSKLEGIAFGFFVPIFFIVSGIKYDLNALLSSSSALSYVPLFLALFLLVRGVPVLLCRRDLPPGELMPMGLMSATALPLVVAIADIGVETRGLRTETAAALVGAGMLSVLLFPLLALMLHRPGVPAAQAAAAQTVAAPPAPPEPVSVGISATTGVS